MGTSATAACRTLHAFLLEQGVKELPRPDLDRLIIRAYDVGVASARGWVATGEAMGLWQRIRRNPSHSLVRLNPLPDMAQPLSIDTAGSAA